MKLQDAFDQCLELHWKGTAGETMAQINGQRAVDFFGNVTLESITAKKVWAFTAELARMGNAPGTINRKLAALSKILRVAFNNGDTEKQPHFHQYKREPKGRTRWLTQQEQHDVIAVLEGRGMIDHAQVVEMLAATGLRPSELWRVTAKDISDNVLIIPITKTGKPRAIPLNARALFICQRRMVRFSDGVLFPYDNAWINYGWNLAKKQLGKWMDKEFVVYSLRHTCASRMVQNDIPLQVVQNWLGHSNIATTTRYAHLSIDNLQRAMKKMEEAK